MAILKKTSYPEDLNKYQTLIKDADPNSRYFKITELPDTFTGGKNAFLVAGSSELVADTLIKIEIKDSRGNIIYHEPGEGIISSSVNGELFISEYYEGVSKVVSVYVYPDTPYGACTLTILGELSKYDDGNGFLTPVPFDWQGKYNVKWQKNINVNPSLPNTTKIRFYKRPTVSINEIISPVYRINPSNGLKINTGINQSFADIKISNLETFAGDVKRIKVFRTSEGTISDYDMIQDILVESKELLTSYGLSGSVVGNTGILTSETLKNYWITGSLTATLDSNKVEAGVKLKGGGSLTYSSSLDLKSTNTYEINLDAFYSSSTSSNLGIYLSQTTTSFQNGIQVPITISSSIATLVGTQPTKNLLDTTIPFKIDRNYPSASLYFSQSQGEWNVGNISLKLSEDTAFSPDEVSFVTTVPTVVGNEDFNFKFEFYDVNNNFVPVLVTGSANFTGGSNTITKLLTFESDRTAFRFSTGSFANPQNQFVRFKTIKTNFTGSITYASAAFDIGGTYIQPASYAGTYPGWFTSQNDNGALLSIASFSGSVSSTLIGSIVYTASCEGFEEYETIYRFEDGDNAPGVFVTANTNQFIYKATDLSLNPAGQVITIEAKRKNLASATTLLTVNSGSGKPPLTLVTTNSTNGVNTYTLAGSSYSYGVGETTYYISGSDQFGNQFSDAIKISPVKILDGLSVSLTNDNASLPARSTGFVESGSFVLSSGSVGVKVGNEVITHSNGLSANNRFDIISAVATNVQTGSLDYSTIDYFISRLDADSGSLNLTIRYKDGAGDTSDTTKLVTYSKAKIGTPNVVVAVSPSAQSISSNSRGSGSASPATLTITALEGNTSRFISIGTPTYTNGLAGTVSTNTITFTSTASSMFSDTGQVTIPVNYTDSEGISGTKNIIATVSKAKTAVPNVEVSVSPQAQSVTALADGSSPSAPTSLTVKALEGGTTRLTTVTATVTNVTAETIVYDPVSGTPKNYATIPLSAVAADNASVVITINYTDSEGTTGTKTLTATISKAKKGTNGDNGNPGADGKRTATGLLYYQSPTGTAPPKPTATLYTFSTNAFSTPALSTEGWAQGAPTYNAGNTNKYWYTTYTAIETTTGGNTSVPSYSTVTQAIGFTGLVTFTSTDNISDGSGNTSEIIPKGSITNHIGGANVTTINGGKISTGTITSTQYTLIGSDTLASGSYMGNGTIFNLDNNGSIRSKNFYISPAGDAFFKGTLSAPTGNIGGWSIGSTFISASRTLLKNDGVIELRNSEQSVKVTIDGGTSLPDPQAGASNISLSLPQMGPNTATITVYTQYVSTTNTITITKTGSYRFRATIPSSGQNGIVSNPSLQWMIARLYINSVERQVITGFLHQSVGNYPAFGLNFTDFDLNLGDTVYIRLENDFYAASGGTDITYYIPPTTITGISNVPKVGINQEGFQIIQDSSRFFTIKPSTLDFYNNSVGAQDRKIIGTQSGPLVLNNAVMNEWHNGWQNVYHRESTTPLVHEAGGGNVITSYYWGGKNRAFQIIRAYGIIGTGVSTNWYVSMDYTYKPDYFWYNVDTVTRNGAFEYTVTFVEPIYSYDTVREGTEYYSVFVGGRGATPGFGPPQVTNISNTGFTVNFFQLSDVEDAQFSFIVVK